MFLIVFYMNLFGIIFFNSDPFIIKMNIIIPIGGKGERFKNNNYIYPKPFINIFGHPIIFWLIDNLSLQIDDKLYIGIYDEDEFGLEFKIRSEYPSLKFQIVNLLYQTRGAVETIFNILQQMSDDELNRKVLSLDCDTIYFEDVLTKFRMCDNNSSFYFNAKSKPEIFSYILCKDDIILDIREKKFFNNNEDKLANTGAYGFKNGIILKEYCKYILNNDVKFRGEYYTSLLIKQMICESHVFNAIEINNFKCVGTPEQLKEFIKEVEGSSSDKYKCKQKRFCFDLENTLIDHLKKPKITNVILLRTLKTLGHYIIIYSSREITSKEITLNTLEEFNIPFDQLEFGKPCANHYIDDLGINSLYNLDTNIGCSQNKINKNYISARNFNKIIEVGNNIIKTSTSKDFDGQIFFYENLQTRNKHLFPEIYSTKNDIIQMEKINGITLSYLLVSKVMTKYQLLKLLYCVRDMHEIRIDEKDSNIYLNYKSKVKERYEQYKDVYDELNQELLVANVYENIMMDLQYYEENDLGIKSSIIHGDLVFSNIILSVENKFKFIDARGKLGNLLSLEGDICYDLSKILQSLYGYDFVILRKDVDCEYLMELRNVFYEWVGLNYHIVSINNIKCICKSLFFSLIPLHDKELRSIFFDIILNYIK